MTPIGGDIARFLSSPVMIITGTCDAALRPAIGRAVGARVDAERALVELTISRWQWPQTVANIAATGALAVTFARPSDYTSFQIKGEATLRDAAPDDIALAERYISAITATLTDLGIAPEIVAPWLTCREAVVAALSVRDVFVQTPGPKAGTPLAAAP